MKRIVAYMLFLIFLCMLIPIIFTNRRIEKVNGELVENEEVKQEQPKEEYIEQKISGNNVTNKLNIKRITM